MVDVTVLLNDLRDESAALDALVAGLGPAGFATPTPAEGWTVAHQIAHLAWTDQWSLLSCRDGERFTAEVLTHYTNVPEPVDAGAAEGVGEDPAALLARWRAGRAELAGELATAAATDRRLPWFGPPMKAASMATARLMETWAHGQDVADALGATVPPTDRLRHVAHLGVRTVGFAFALHGLPVPETPIRVELTSPSGELWTWGPPEAADSVRGPALDFCLLVTQRRSRSDLALVATGPVADSWLPIAQAFAGNPGKGR
ncbi:MULTISPECIES: TIGR03084 family metal-binding protein [unclassified Kitasatospora]|uniref:TIGR03084 family metal-binding protein n=1 Tax=unclassified Kitasatospora TaxID=2633591 RepID=UPI000708FE19|nr:MULTISPECIES: TIGR03084 family metal-binding protein [unclassified Kitasatospora]KQV21793.1 wyosine base formation domain-containing protein [Kitasatospora sp. Root107]KRB75415.1 wyosine base formation domain-containing protein [Kitasatospora sp. Root187]